MNDERNNRRHVHDPVGPTHASADVWSVEPLDACVGLPVVG